jgi:predicted dehydrogenase
MFRTDNPEQESVPMPAFPPAPFAVFNVGNGPEGFIFNAAWRPQMAASGHFRLTGACSENAAHREWAISNYNLSPFCVTTDWRRLLDNAVEQYGPAVVASITAPTFLHADMIGQAVEAGVRNIVTDKPVCPRLADYKALRESLSGTGARCAVSFNHNYMMPSLALRALVAQSGLDAVERISTWFLQSFFLTDPRIRQSGWRLKDRFGSLTDIGSHAGVLASWIAGSPIRSVSGVRMGIAGAHGSSCLDNGEMGLEFENGLTGRTTFPQALAGHFDDLGAMVTFRPGVLPEGARHAMFRMELGTDALLVSSGDGNPDDPAQWRYQVLGPGTLCPESVLPLRFTPPGHTEGWPDGWRRLFCALAGWFWREQRAVSPADCTGVYALPVPDFDTIGDQSMRFIGAAIAGFEGGGQSEVVLGEL